MAELINRAHEKDAYNLSFTIVVVMEWKMLVLTYVVWPGCSNTGSVGAERIPRMDFKDALSWLTSFTRLGFMDEYNSRYTLSCFSRRLNLIDLYYLRFCFRFPGSSPFSARLYCQGIMLWKDTISGLPVHAELCDLSPFEPGFPIPIRILFDLFPELQHSFLIHALHPHFCVSVVMVCGVNDLFSHFCSFILLVLIHSLLVLLFLTNLCWQWKIKPWIEKKKKDSDLLSLFVYSVWFSLEMALVFNVSISIMTRIAESVTCW